MLHLTHKLPPKMDVACSGGSDSVAGLLWLNTSRKVRKVLHVNHNTGKFSADAEKFVRALCTKLGLPLEVTALDFGTPDGVSKEAYWRFERYKFFLQDFPVVTCHTFDDCVEEYLMCTLVRGRVGVIPYNNKNVIRPFRLWGRDSMREYLTRHEQDYVEDPSNEDLAFKRNFIRHKVIPVALDLNPGLYRVVKSHILLK